MILLRRTMMLAALFFLGKTGTAQICTALGQNPSTAFPVCGTTTFNQANVPICATTDIYVPGCTGTGNTRYQNKNPYWYKFHCFQAGTLGFLVTPIDPGDDYDWQLWDITGLDPNVVFTTNPSLIVGGNWSGTYGATGASASGVNYIQCASVPSDNKPSFARMQNLILDHDYILLISHFSDSQSGYSLSFGGGSASITDPTEPHLGNASAACDGTTTTIKLNKKMKCNSLSSDGSEFTISPPLANVVNATGFGCSAGFDMDSVILTLDAPLPAGTYTINIKDGVDNNTLSDNCDRFIPTGENVPLTIFPVFPTPFDSIAKPGCAPDEIQLVFKKNIRCNSIAADGSDYVITGSTPVTIIGASGNCNNGLTPIIKLKLSAPILTKGNYQVTLVNSFIDECGQQTSSGTVSFSTKDTVNADFSYALVYGCTRDTINYFHDGRNEVNVWKWNFDNLRKSTVQNPQISYATAGQKATRLFVSNGVCTDTSEWVPILLDPFLKAGFETNEFVCPGDQASFKDTSIGRIAFWLWDFGNGSISTLPAPAPQSYSRPFSTITVMPRLTVTDNKGCNSTATQKIILPDNCYIAVPSAFTPNNDGLNDYLYPLNAWKALDLLFRVYNRFGQVMFETRDWMHRWDGKFRGQGADTGAYVWILQYVNRDTGKQVFQKGSTILIR